MKISQRENYSANFGEVLRSSAIFWVKQDEGVSTVISFGNYWKFKNNTDVTLVLNARGHGGQLIERRRISFDDGEVMNLRPADGVASVEIEVFSLRNMRIPYSAIMAVYECTDSISMVHSYSRVYSQHEIEEKRCITQGEESCWTVREDADTTSFGVFHNGASTTPAQTVTLRVRRHDGEERTCAVEVPELAPFEMVTVEPAAHFSNLSAWLENRAGNARLSFKVSGAFTRMLCGVRRRDWRELQVTHSNFDYSTHETDKISEGNLTAYMRTPRMPQDVGHTELVVYPDSDPGNYRLTDDAGALSFQSPALVTRAYADAREKLAKFQRSDEVLPTRIVTAFRAQAGTGALPAECSLGVIHHKRPAKHFSWMLVSKAFDSSVNWVDFEEVYGGCPASAEVVFNLYSAASKSALTKTWTHEQLPSGKLMRLDEIFPDENVAGFLANDHGCLSAWSAYGGFMFFSTLRKHESLTIEHSF